MDITKFFQRKRPVEVSESDASSNDTDSDDQSVASAAASSQRTSTTTSSVKRRRVQKTYQRPIKPEFLEKYGIANVEEQAICVVCNERLPNSSMTEPKLERHMKTHKSVANLADSARKQVFAKRFQQMRKEQTVIRRALTLDEKVAVTAIKVAWQLGRRRGAYTDGEAIVAPIQNES
jgi:hypothetical protein